MLMPKNPSSAARTAIFADVAVKRLVATQPKPTQNGTVLRDYLIRQGTEFCCAVIAAVNNGTDSVELQMALRIYAARPWGEDKAPSDKGADAVDAVDIDDEDESAADEGSALDLLTLLHVPDDELKQPTPPKPEPLDLEKVIATLTELHGPPADQLSAERQLARIPAQEIAARLAEIEARRLDPAVEASWFEACPYECKPVDLSAYGITEELPADAYAAFKKLRRELNSKRERIVFPAIVSVFNISNGKRDHEGLFKEASKPRLALRLSRDEIDVAFAAAYEDAPWLKDPLAYLHEAAVERAGQDFSLPPVLIFGPAGCGKTTLASNLGRHLGIESRRVEMAGATAVFDVSGSERTWATAYPGVPVTLATTGTYATSICVFDEVEKAGGAFGSRSGGNPLDALLGLLSDVTRKSYRCPFLKTEVDLTHVSFILAANSISAVSAPLKDRCSIFEVGMPSHEQVLALIQKADPEGLILEEARRALAKHVSNGRMSLRKMQRAIETMQIDARRQRRN